MLTRRIAAAVLLIGGCTERDEGGALCSVEELSFRKTPEGIDMNKSIVYKLREPRRSPAVFAEKNGFLVLGGCQRKGVHTGSAERIRWNRNLLESSNSVFQNVVEAKSCSAFFKLDECAGVLIGGFNGLDCLKSVNLVKLNEREVLPTRLSTARENHVCEIIFDRYLVVMAGWDGRQALDSVEVFEIIDESPWILPTGIQFSLCEARIRPVSTPL
ncbi:unnamed protein product [Haemonchus placei]|uniref:Kelch repeat protein n=1 Tax=Haemonchus placei TaxID=6290 RepID=A0A0N4WZ52_HAEPC|nr:unnamed protein product [Haemonchus placei]